MRTLRRVANVTVLRTAKSSDLDISDSLVGVTAGDDQHRVSRMGLGRLLTGEVFVRLPVLLGDFRHSPDNTVLSVTAGVFNPCPT
jgi:hypothetical protein